MQIDWWTLGLQAVNALVLIWLLAHFLFRPVVDAIAARQKAAGQLLADAKAAKAAAEGERDKAAAETARLVEHRGEALKAAEAEAATEKSALLAAAQAEADKLRAAAKAEIEAESLGADGASVRLTAARAVTPEEVEACRKALVAVLGHPVLLEVTVEPELIAGLELEAPHAVVRNSFRADLIRLKSGLVHHDTDAA